MEFHFQVTKTFFSLLGYVSDQLMKFTDGNLTRDGVVATGGIFATYPSDGTSQVTGFFDQIVGTGLLLFCVRGITDAKNGKVPAFIQPFLIGLVVLIIDFWRLLGFEE